MPVATIVLKSRRAQPLLAGHPWVFSGAIQETVDEPAVGAEVQVVTDKGQFVGYGLYNPNSNIAVRIYSHDESRRLDDEFWASQISRAISLRRELKLPTPAGASRLIFSEADGLSGLIVDQYGDWLLLQWTSLALSQRADAIVRILQSQIPVAGVWRRTEKGIREAEGLDISDGLIAGTAPPTLMQLVEHGLTYAVDVVTGQKTGLFIDQRDNRLAAAKFLNGRNVLDVCCYSGAFGLNALKNGNAASVIAVDVSASALSIAEQNAQLNGLADKISFEKSDAFKALERFQAAGQRFSAIILDPPKMTRNARGLDEALRGYHSLNRLAVDVLEPGGILVTCSCSGHVSAEMFEMVLSDVAAASRRDIQILEHRGAAADHPVSVRCPETKYLKCVICRVS